MVLLDWSFVIDLKRRHGAKGVHVWFGLSALCFRGKKELWENLDPEDPTACLWVQCARSPPCACLHDLSLTQLTLPLWDRLITLEEQNHSTNYINTDNSVFFTDRSHLPHTLSSCTDTHHAFHKIEGLRLSVGWILLNLKAGFQLSDNALPLPSDWMLLTATSLKGHSLKAGVEVSLATTFFTLCS